MGNSKVYLIPNTLGEETNIAASIPSYNIDVIKQLHYFAVEHLKDSRRFLIRCGLKHKINESVFIEFNNKSNLEQLDKIIAILKAGNALGIISDAGCPGIADPGAKIVAAAHRNNIAVEPLVGPSSILLALIASGFNGQSFTFHGYLPREVEKRIKKLQQIELQSAKNKQTQIFMETPYRNEALFNDILKHLSLKTKLSIATDITLPTEYIKSKTIKEWKSDPQPKLHKRPTIFLLLG